MFPQPEPIRVLIVDDEPPARQRLADLLGREPGIASLVEADSGLRAVEAIESGSVDLVFLDVQMPELDGLGVIDAVGADAMPLTIFVTAYDQHAIRAFESNALDYLLKPFTDERFEAAMARVRRRWLERGSHALSRQVLDLLSATQPGGRRWDRLVVKSAGATRFIPAAEIDWIEAAGVYASLHVSGKEILYRATLSELSTRLDPERFIRIHRSAIVNIERIVQLEPISHGEFEVLLKDGSRARVSRGYRAQLEARLGQNL